MSELSKDRVSTERKLASPKLEKCAVGVAELDAILEGGLPRLWNVNRLSSCQMVCLCVGGSVVDML